jgi:hypothetical protein
VRPEVDDRVRPQLVLEPEVRGHVLVVRRQVLGVVEGLEVLRARAVRLRQEDHVPAPERGDDEAALAAGVLRRHDVGRLGRAEARLDRLAEGARQRVEPAAVAGDREQDDVAARDEPRELSRRGARDVAPALDDRPLEDGGALAFEVVRTRIVTAGAEVAEDGRDAPDDVQVARAHVLLARRVVPEEDRHAPLAGGRAPEVHERPRARRDALDALGDGRGADLVARHARRADHVRRREAVKLGDRELGELVRLVGLRVGDDPLEARDVELELLQALQRRLSRAPARSTPGRGPWPRGGRR